MRFVRSKFVQYVSGDGETVWGPASRPKKSGWVAYDMGDGTALVAYDDDAEIARNGRDIDIDPGDDELTPAEAAAVVPDGVRMGVGATVDVEFRGRKAIDRRTGIEVPARPPRAAVRGG